ncbi:MAG: DUF1016 N-terminal domain-containing protein [Candidatus Omnitrophica bacterium]|nr:DUF1016 N-terminal domain-containing protein [Candidatus Omnitrophota bacterium]
MTGIAVVKKSIDSTPASYTELRRRVHETLFLGQRRIEETRVWTYWVTGWWIREYLLQNRSRARRGGEVLGKLSKDEGISVSVLDRCRQFAEKFPKLFPDPYFADGRHMSVTPYPASKKESKFVLTWSHYRTLLPVEDGKLRIRLAREAACRRWTVPELESQLQLRGKGTAASGHLLSAPTLLTPKKGELFTYRIIKEGGGLALDHGFASYWNLSGKESTRFREGDIVRKIPGGKIEKLQNASADLLYTYEADVIRVVDGDTVWMKIYLEGHLSPPWVKEKLRLRDIDAPELSTPEGKVAKQFVESQIKATERILITTTKPDKWDRYLSDVFLIQPDGQEIYLNNLLLEKGCARLKTRWSLSDWET